MLPLLLAGAGMVGAGALSNYFGGNPMDRVNNQADQWKKRFMNRDPGQYQAGQLANLGSMSGFRDNQADLISRLDAQSRGQGPSMAMEALKAATDRNMRQQSSIAQTGRGNAALAGITAANNSAQLGQQSAQDAAQARIAEIMAAQQQLGSVSGQARQQDQDLSQFNALQQNYRDQFNADAMAKYYGQQDNNMNSYLGFRYGSAGQPRFGDQMMAGGAGLLGLWGSQQGSKR